MGGNRGGLGRDGSKGNSLPVMSKAEKQPVNH